MRKFLGMHCRLANLAVAIVPFALATGMAASEERDRIPIKSIASFVQKHGELDFAPSEARELYVENIYGHGFSITHDDGSLTVTTSLEGCGRFDAPLSVAVLDIDGDGGIDHWSYSLEEWTCEDPNLAIPFSKEHVQMIFDTGLDAIARAIVTRESP